MGRVPRVLPSPDFDLPPLCPSQRFFRWVRAFGLARLAQTMRISRSTVYRWVSPESYVMQPALARGILWLAAHHPLDIGPLDWHDIYNGPASEARKVVGKVARPRLAPRVETEAQFFAGLVQRGVCTVETAEADLGISPAQRRLLEAYAARAGGMTAREIRREIALRDQALAEFRRLCAAALPRAA